MRLHTKYHVFRKFAYVENFELFLCVVLYMIFFLEVTKTHTLHSCIIVVNLVHFLHDIFFRSHENSLYISLFLHGCNRIVYFKYLLYIISSVSNYFIFTLTRTKVISVILTPECIMFIWKC